ncbi:hypothetical protein F5Y04DRAFT_210837 [Hypomontagnella monticulosa]|nr:hypothetical protein F5Y04DRAFT_210837 [Hypomontagnella monticulosa]
MQSIVGSEVNIATLQRVNIHAIQREIVQLTGRFVKNRELKENDIVVLRTLMKDYCTAWRDWDLMLERTATADKDPFRISTNNKLSQKLMHEAGLLNQETIGEILASENPRSPIGFKKPHSLQLPAGGRHAKLLDEQVKEATLRFTWAVGAGLFLLLPVLIMSLLPTLIISLIVTSLSVFLFAFTASFISAGLVPGLNLKDFGVKDILASTLAYAAVLVVFVGTSVQQQTSNTASA